MSMNVPLASLEQWSKSGTSHTHTSPHTAHSLVQITQQAACSYFNYWPIHKHPILSHSTCSKGAPGGLLWPWRTTAGTQATPLFLGCFSLTPSTSQENLDPRNFPSASGPPRSVVYHWQAQQFLWKTQRGNHLEKQSVECSRQHFRESIPKVMIKARDSHERQKKQE